MSAPLTTREAIEQAIYDVAVDHDMWIGDDGEPLDYLPEREARIGDFIREAADALLASGALTDAGKLAALADKWNSTPDYAPTDYDRGRVDQRHAMTAELLAALSAQSERTLCACGKPAEHVNADPDTAEWACRVPDFDRMTGRLSAQSERAEVER